MDYVLSSKESNHDHEEASMFGQFPWPFVDDISTSAMLPNHKETARTVMPPPSPSKTKRVRKKRSAGKKDRHSKIHTAQGLRDRRMRLSLHIARKFFGLQDMLGFDKASKTIEWLFSKSKNAIEEVTERVKSQNTAQNMSTENIQRCQTPLSDCVVDSDVLATESDVLARESRQKARARARERTREKWKHMVEANNPDHDDFDQMQLGFPVNPNNHHMEESSSLSPLEYSGARHFFQMAEMDDIGEKTTGASSSSEFGYNKNFANPPAGWLNSSNTFLGFIGGWDSDNLRMESENYGILPNIVSSTTGDIYAQGLSSLVIPDTNLD